MAGWIQPSFSAYPWAARPAPPPAPAPSPVPTYVRRAGDVNVTAYPSPGESLLAGGVGLAGGGGDTAAQAASVQSGGIMADAQTVNTLRAGGAFTIPEEFKQFLPLIMIFILIVIVMLKK